MSRDLVIIEAPGKLRTLYGVFAQVGLHADICATIGHFLENPSDLKDLAIGYRDGQFIEPKRQPHRPDSFACLRDQLRRCAGRILIATDNDHEGHVIAQDVATLIRAMQIKQPVYRMLFPGLDAESVRNALNHLQPIDPSKAVPGTARRITDRLIGGCLSDFEENLPVGRVQSALLGLCVQGVAHSHINVKMPAADGGKPFLGQLPVFGATNPAQLIAELGVFELPPAPVAGREVVAMSSPLNYGDALVELNAALGIDVERAGELLQQMYECGDISYARTASRGFTGAGAAAVEQLARIKGIMTFKKDRLPRVDAHGLSEPHEAIRVLNESLFKRLDIGKPIKLHASERDAAQAIIARRSVEAGIPVQRDYPDLRQAPEWAQAIAWHRDTRRAILPWRAAEPAATVRHDQKSALVAEMMAHGIGKPSTWAGHASRFLSRGLVDDAFRLTIKGRELFDIAPPALKDVLSSARIEALLDNEQEQVGELVIEALGAALDQDLGKVQQILEQLEAIADEYDDPENNYRPTL
ncbi:toprim domain-containing protein [Chromobacterium haemolyticum]|uniref:toprim domain-containing protein n=1 Tax=Chromobacterium haemolyticum TaxID=394935 RepID=UPI002447DFAF|nr:toprim domain-containing protein [Chromobacterium haemolyticum]MDH0342150.1 toprim domain-containing protein [Chromobacterium haemolyticum]